MTTQHTHHEHSDVDASVVEHPSAPKNETQVNPTASETENSAINTGEASISSPELASSEDVQVEHNDEVSTYAAPTVIAQDTNERIEASVAENTDAHGGHAHETEHAASPEGKAAESHDASPTFEQNRTAEDDIQWGSSRINANDESLQRHQAESEEVPSAPVENQEVPAIALEAQEALPVEATATNTTTAEEAVYQQEAAAGEGELQPVEQGQEAETLTLQEQSVPGSQAPTQEEEPVVKPQESEKAVASETETVEQPISQVEVPSQARSQDITFPYAKMSPLIESKAEEVRPFTEFIAEFRQAEAALQATLRDTQLETLSILSSVATDLVHNDQEEQTPVLETSHGDEGTNQEVPKVQRETTEPVAEPQQAASETKDEKKTEATSEKATNERPVSPLLRPASRLRLPRHGIGRHQREEMAAAEPAAQEQASKPEETAATPEPSAEVTPARPARRYRFDRPASSSGSVTQATNTASAANQPASQPRVEETRAATTQNRAAEATQPVEQPGEPQGQKQVAQEEISTPAAPTEHGRRRHGQKEQSASASGAQSTTPVVEPTPAPEAAAQTEEIAPEDLPPLEYSELQKASSRRRRRHRSGSSGSSSVSNTPNNTTSTPSTSSVPITPVHIPPQVPPSTAQRLIASQDNQTYSIVSGYTVNQMNQGNELSGPFMGPDPSPARGSLMTRDGRTGRPETRPAVTPSPVYPTRSSEGGISTAAMTQFANVVAQALQTQTDRMVTEFRRMSQAPTNVSVTLPPFPSTERVGVFVDVANLLYSARTLRIGVDFGKLLDFLRGNRRLVRAHAYCPTSPQPSDEQMFLQAVKGLGYRITTKNYKTFSSGAKKADLDLDLCMDVVRLVDGRAVDCIVLVSGDSDFMPMLDYCSDHGVRVEVAAFDEAMSATLRQSCDLFINLSMLEEIRA